MSDGMPDRLASVGRFSIRYGEDVIAYTLRLQPQRQPSKVAIHDHSARFYRLLDRHMPGWRGVKARLDDMAEDLLRQ